MKVLHVIRDVRPFGGKQRYVKETLALWRSHGHCATVLSMDEEVRTWDVPTRVLPRLAVNALNPFHRGVAALKRLYNADAARLGEWLASERFDIVHLHDHTHFSIALLEALEHAAIPAVYTLHDYQFLCPVSTLFREHERTPCEACRGGHYSNAVRYRCSHRRIWNSLLSAVDAWLHVQAGVQTRLGCFIAPSDAVLQIFRHFGWRQSRFTHLPHFISIRPSDTCHDYQLMEKPRVLCVARLWNHKGVHVLVQAAAYLKASSLEIVIVGDGPRYAELQQQVARLGLGNIRFLGSVDADAIRKCYATATCVIIPSIWPEVFGLVALEAFAACRPVIASRVGGLTELIDDGVDGWLVPPGDAEALAARLDWMLSHPAEAAEMGRAGYRKATTTYTPERHYRGLCTIYNQVIEEHKRSLQ